MYATSLGMALSGVLSGFYGCRAGALRAGDVTGEWAMFFGSSSSQIESLLGHPYLAARSRRLSATNVKMPAMVW